MLGNGEAVPVIQRLMSDLLAVDVCDAAGNDRRKLTLDDFLIMAQDFNSASKNRWFAGAFLQPEWPRSVGLCGTTSSRHIQRVPSKVRVSEIRRARSKSVDCWDVSRATTSRHIGRSMVTLPTARCIPAIARRRSYWNWLFNSKPSSTGRKASQKLTLYRSVISRRILEVSPATCSRSDRPVVTLAAFSSAPMALRSAVTSLLLPPT